MIKRGDPMSKACPARLVSAVEVPVPWRGSAHLVVLAFPHPVGYVCPVSGEVEDRAGFYVGRFCEEHEVEVAREVAGILWRSGHWSSVAIYLNDGGEGSAYELTEGVHP